MASFPRHFRRTVSLREDFARSSAPLRVDRDAGVIYGVKILGLESINGMPGMPKVTRRVYTKDAVARATGLYEGCHVNIDHPRKAGEQRSTYDRFARIENIQVREDGLYGDLHYLKSHPMADRITEAAERMPDVFGLSHSADTRGDVRGDAYYVVEIVNVNAVDVVADPGSTNGLFEGRNMSKPTDEAACAMPAKEDDMEAPGYEEHLGNAISAILQDDGMDMAAKKKKIAHLVSTMEKGEETEEESEDDGEGEASKPAKDPKDKPAEEAVAALRASSDPAVKALLEEVDALKTKFRVQEKVTKAHQLIEEARLPKEAVSELFVDQLVRARDDKEMKKLVEDRRALAVAKKPRSMGKTDGSMDAKAFAKALKG